MDFSERLDLLNSMSHDEINELAIIVNETMANVKFIPFPGTQTRAYFSEADILLYGGKPGGGKRIHTEQLVPVPLSTDVSGYKKHGDLSVGDFVYGADGLPKRVLQVHPLCHKPDAYEVGFSTGEVIKCDGQHLWETTDLQPEKNILTALDIKRTLKENGKLNHSVATVVGLAGDHVDLPIDPYLFGLWLGDGSCNEGDICMVKLRDLGVLMDKHIPSMYLRAGIDQRKELLRGLMDANGTCNAVGWCELDFSNRRLSHDSLDLINGLGVKASISKIALSMVNKDYKDFYKMKFLPDFYVFKLERNLNKQRPLNKKRIVSSRAIISVSKCSPVPMNCITVDGGLYCLGGSYIVTHNSALIAGLAIQEHTRSLLVRKNHLALRALIDVAKEINGTPKGFIGGNRPEFRRADGGVIHFMGLAADGGLGSMQGEAHSFIGIDEAAQVAESPFRTLLGWLRATARTPKSERLRVVLASNPPLDSTGDWLVNVFPCWLDDTYPNPAADGELRYFIRDGGMDVECKKDDYVIMNGDKVYAHSRTFIASDYKDNPFYDTEKYVKTLSQMSEEERKILMSGNFLLARPDADRQLIPTAWIRAAQERWRRSSHEGRLMSSIGADVTGSGSDMVAIAPMYDGLYFGEVKTKVGSSYSGPSAMAADIVMVRRGGCPVGVDMGGGYGGGPKEHLNFAGVNAYGFIPNKKTNQRTRDRSYGFYNLRDQAYYRLREALDPEQDGGAVIALPPSKKLLSDLATPLFKTNMFQGRMCVKVEGKDDIKKRIRRSPDEGDAVAIALWVYMEHTKRAGNNSGSTILNASGQPIKAVVGHQNRKRRIRR